MDRLKLGSLFDGSGGFPLGGLLAGVTPVWASEIEPFPIRVTTKRLPGMRHLGDVSSINGADIEPVDIITFGSPCTDMSIAGKRAGLEGAQSSLFYQAIRIIKEMRCATNGRYPRWVCWENVVGAFSSNQGRDFKAVLDAVIGIAEPGASVPMPEKNRWPYADVYMGDGWSVAYRTFDAQHWGVPQRRRRCYLVGDLAGRCAGRVLFESEGLSGYSAEGFRTWQRAARYPSAGAGAAGRICLNDQGGGRMDVLVEVASTLRAESHGHPPCVMAAGFCTEHSAASRSIGYGEECSPTLRAGVVPAAVYENHSQDTRYTGPLDTAPTVSATYGMGGNNQPFVVGMRTYDVRFTSEGTRNARQNVYETDTARTIDTGGNPPDSNQGGVAVVADPAAYAITMCGFPQVSREQAPTLLARDFKDPTSVNRGYTVRRLTPTECARLQGFPDWWCAELETPKPTEADIAFWSEVWETHRRIIGTATKPKTRNQVISWLQTPHSDSAEYKMWGNGVALPNVFFVLAGIVWSTQISGE
ncbi:DNA cytosine methyltransferase [uncultured Oscillibacter sp.]|uniref:DNA cytosine methyltransferase n=1 Tax=uncultured Oscillibacter sp. TaxID=876091 RepID=UPI00262A431F|nr:DNA cytosine methyltransferase [uncultured Oscillibacter sp.]